MRIRPAAGIFIALTVGLMIAFAPAGDSLSPQGRTLAGLFAALLVLWVTEALPLSITALLAVFLQPVFGIEPSVGAAVQSFLSPVFFFVLTMFFVAQAMTVTAIDKRFASWLLSKAGGDSRHVVLALMVGTSTISTIMSDVPACAIFMAVALGILDKAGATPGSSNLGRALMIGIPFASLIGGVGTPAGSAINLLGLDLLQRLAGVRVTFVAWMAIGLPMVVILTPLAWWFVVRVHPPEMASIDPDRHEAGPMSAGEKKLVVILCAMIALWIASSWVRQLDVTVIAVLGGTLMFLPGVDLLDWKRAEKGIGWEGLMLIGGVTSLAAACVKTGLAKWLVAACLGGLQGWDATWTIAAVSAFTVVAHLVVPNNPALVGVLASPIVLLASSSGHAAALYALPMIFSASCGFLLPIETVPLVTYSKGYYSMADMFRAGLPLSICWVALITLLMKWLAPHIGLL
ncbi:MAG: DASS family sodium-coupled anion symporter [Candidatus Solibacter usitatus]|nr:DASS family sodium-coupled anion symporter [Candidatus Solibacter usitatus]